MEGGEPPALDRGHDLSAGHAHPARPARDLRRQERHQGGDRQDRHADARMRSATTSTRAPAAWSTAAPAASRARPACRRRACSAPDKTLKPIAELRAAFEGVGAAPDKRVLVYCGGGIAATLDAFVLTAVARPQERLGVRQLHAGMVERPQPADGNRLREEDDVAAYMIVEVETTDEALMAEYRKHTPGLIAKFGGKFIVRGGKTRTLEGGWTAVAHGGAGIPRLRRRPSTSTIRPRLQAGARHAAEGRQVEGDHRRRPRWLMPGLSWPPIARSARSTTR